MSPHPAKSLLFLLPEEGAGVRARTEQPKVRRYRLVRVRVTRPERLVELSGLPDRLG